MDALARGAGGGAADLAWLRGVEAYTIGAYARAEEEFRTAVAHDPGMADAWLGLHALKVDSSTALLAMVRHRDRFGEQRTIHRRPLNSWFWLGWWVQPMLETADDLTLAHASHWLDGLHLPELDRALDLCPDPREDPRSRFLGACRAYLVKDWETLVRCTQDLYDDPLLGVESALFGGMARIRLGRYAQAEPLLLSALARCRSEQPQRKELRYWLARAYEGQGRSAAALPLYRSVHRADAGFMDAAGRITAILADIDSPEDVEALFDEIGPHLPPRGATGTLPPPRDAGGTSASRGGGPSGTAAGLLAGGGGSLPVPGPRDGNQADGAGWFAPGLAGAQAPAEGAATGRRSGAPDTAAQEPYPGGDGLGADRPCGAGGGTDPGAGGAGGGGVPGSPAFEGRDGLDGSGAPAGLGAGLAGSGMASSELGDDWAVAGGPAVPGPAAPADALGGADGAAPRADDGGAAQAPPGAAESDPLTSALAELEDMVGLEPVKRQVRAISAQLRMAELRRRAGLPVQPPKRHFVFSGPSGTGKTTVARILGRIFRALGLLSGGHLVEAQRPDLVGEFLGQTAIKANELIDSALDGVLFIDEAYSLASTSYSKGDAYGEEALQVLLKRAEDNRDRLVVILAGYPDGMERLLAVNPGLGSRFETRVDFPSYGPRELTRIGEHMAAAGGDRWDPEALEELASIGHYVVEQGWIDGLGNGRFVRALYEKTCAFRDLRLTALPVEPTREELATLCLSDLVQAYGEMVPGMWNGE
ncbi:AAA family ATPase [Allostreptomyces psammosilenae]|uniref:Tetratricopeptide (TPR) repeat protein n=1 Tax=Allostreptomyces psammosilenae TaxID=1892865 RepID=A0A853A1H6_9ACTN|nr:AAA family ATPase [Allostreptomyces psammosilenae]NYI04258.1 tetratricopeptide (TPR) repeat protein [Allostreptomyces psammosilenae]